MSKYARFDPENKKANRKKRQYMDDYDEHVDNSNVQIGRFHKREMLDLDYDWQPKPDPKAIIR